MVEKPKRNASRPTDMHNCLNKNPKPVYNSNRKIKIKQKPKTQNTKREKTGRKSITIFKNKNEKKTKNHLQKLSTWYRGKQN